MKKTVASTFLLMAIFACPSEITAGKKGNGLKTTSDSLSYAIGVMLYDDFIGQFPANVSLPERVNPSGIKKGYKEARKRQARLSPAKLHEILRRLQSEADEKWKQENIAFLEQNGSRPEIHTTESGLQYEILEKSNSIPAYPDNSERPHLVEYTGKLINGTVIDESWVRYPEGISFLPSRVVPGFREGLEMMSPGDRFILYIPADLGYGKHPAASSTIPPESVLIFDIRLLGYDEEED